ncbi:MAG: hypothetical protein WC483_03610 [Candidatus Paceibacterota bacterium]
MNCANYLAYVNVAAKMRGFKVAGFMPRLQESFTLLQEALARQANRDEISGRVLDCYRGSLVLMSFVVQREVPITAFDKFGGMLTRLFPLICSDAALTVNQAFAIRDWIRGTAIAEQRDAVAGFIHPIPLPSASGIEKGRRILEVFGGSGYNAAILSSTTDMQVISSDISTIEQPDVAGCETESERVQLLELIRKKEELARISPAQAEIPLSFYALHKLEASDAVDQYASPDTVLFMCMPPTKKGVVERVIERFKSKGGRAIILVGMEGRPNAAATAMLHSLYREDTTTFFSPLGAIPMLPAIIGADLSSFVPAIRLFVARE